ncbi:MAG TPA: helicase, partial [Ktedonobacteraceae bacterium]|nr:helicase [Ktedonobacteraceae bacterium]
MNVINLPPVLPSDLDLTVVNQLLQAGEATLDWSQVEDASLEHLVVLLSGLDLVEHSEILGIGTIPDELSDVVLRALSRSESKAPHLHEHKGPINKSLSPIVWEPEEKTDLDSAVPPFGDVQQSPVTQPLMEAPHAILQPPSPAALRDELEQLVLQDLLGPAGGPEEELDEGSVRDRYLLGMLAPRDQQIVPEELDELAIPEEGSIEDGPNDDTALQITSLFPSSIGMSFCVDNTATSLSVKASWGYYRREHSETLKTPKGAPKTVWKRQSMSGTPHIFPLKEGPLVPWSPEAEEQPNVVVRGIVRRSEGSWTVTLFLVNEQREPE